MRVGILGGTFDPIHLAHLRLAEEVREALELERVRFVPAGDPPQKPRPGAAACDRLEMVRLATCDHPSFEVDDRELNRPGPSFSADTLAELRASDPGADLWFILGSDQLRKLHTWSRPEQILSLASLAVVRRPGDPEARPERAASSALEPLLAKARVRAVEISWLEISSSDIRARVSRGASIRYLVPSRVREFIENRKLYREDP
ncbi:MAG: nicotinate-nucleotide adenylyltransferase [Myxococcota bacterium]